MQVKYSRIKTNKICTVQYENTKIKHFFRTCVLGDIVLTHFCLQETLLSTRLFV